MNNSAPKASEMRVRVLFRVRSDFLAAVAEGRMLVLEPGEYPVTMNPHGAVSVVLPKGTLGLKPDEFEWIQPSPKAFREWARLLGGSE